VRAVPVTTLAPPPEAIAEPAGEQLKHLDRMTRELDLQWFKPDLTSDVDQLLCLVAPEMAELVVMPAVRRAEERRDVPEGVGHGHPHASAGLQHTCKLAQGCHIVRQMLEHRYRKPGAGRSGGLRKPFGGAADPERLGRHTLGLGEPAGGEEPSSDRSQPIAGHPARAASITV
jgi:hypothetical protein